MPKTLYILIISCSLKCQLQDLAYLQFKDRNKESLGYNNPIFVIKDWKQRTTFPFAKVLFSVDHTKLELQGLARDLEIHQLKALVREHHSDVLIIIEAMISEKLFK